jgi:hypothetical protein
VEPNGWNRAIPKTTLCRPNAKNRNRANQEIGAPRGALSSQNAKAAILAVLFGWSFAAPAPFSCYRQAVAACGDLARESYGGTEWTGFLFPKTRCFQCFLKLFSEKFIFSSNQKACFASIVCEVREREIWDTLKYRHNSRKINLMTKLNANSDNTPSTPPKRGGWRRLFLWGALAGGVVFVLLLIILIALTVPNLRREVAPPEVSGAHRVTQSQNSPEHLTLPTSGTLSVSVSTSGTQPFNLDDFPHLSPTMRKMTQEWLDQIGRAHV